MSIRRAVPDAAGVAAVATAIVAERIHSAVDRAWTIEEDDEAVMEFHLR